MVVGGASIYEQFLPFVDTMYLTIINDKISHEVDCYFPLYNMYNWDINILKEGRENNLEYKIKKYIKIKS